MGLTRDERGGRRPAAGGTRSRARPAGGAVGGCARRLSLLGWGGRGVGGCPPGACLLFKSTTGPAPEALPPTATGGPAVSDEPLSLGSEPSRPEAGTLGATVQLPGNLSPQFQPRPPRCSSAVRPSQSSDAPGRAADGLGGIFPASRPSPAHNIAQMAVVGGPDAA